MTDDILYVLRAIDTQSPGYERVIENMKGPPLPVIQSLSFQPLEALMVGDSYVSRLENFCNRGLEKHTGLGLKEWHVRFIFKIGGTSKLADLDHLLRLSNYGALKTDTQVDAFLIQLGGNDLTGTDGAVEGLEGLQEGGGPVTLLAQRLVDAAHALRAKEGRPRVIIGKLMYRGVSKWLPTPHAKEAYNLKVEAVNLELDRLATTLEPGIRVWGHKGREQCAEAMLATDGTHLNPYGMGKYWWSWRRALISTRAQMDPGQ